MLNILYWSMNVNKDLHKAFEYLHMWCIIQYIKYSNSRSHQRPRLIFGPRIKGINVGLHITPSNPPTQHNKEWIIQTDLIIYTRACCDHTVLQNCWPRRRCSETARSTACCRGKVGGQSGCHQDCSFQHDKRVLLLSSYVCWLSTS